jgi:hypothetical protein
MSREVLRQVVGDLFVGIGEEQHPAVAATGYRRGGVVHPVTRTGR